MLLYVAFPFAEISYWEAVLNSATLPPDSDSIGISIMGTFGTTIVLFPVYLLLALFALRRYSGGSSLWAKPRNIEGWVWTVLALILGASCVFQLLSPLWDPIWGGWAQLHTAASLAAVPFFQAAAVDRHPLTVMPAKAGIS
jgi:hypothetical protein